MKHARRGWGIWLVALGLLATSGALAQGHTHVAPHGGALVMIGQHQFNLELVREAEAGKLSLFILDAHAENFLRLPAPTIAATITRACGCVHEVEFAAVAQAETGETVGDTSQFDFSAKWITASPEFQVTIPRLEIRGRVFENIRFPFPAGLPHGAKETQ